MALLSLVPWVYSFAFITGQNSFRKTMSSVISPFDFSYDDALQSAFSIVNLDIHFLSWDSINLPISSYTLFWFWWKNSSSTSSMCSLWIFYLFNVFTPRQKAEGYCYEHVRPSVPPASTVNIFPSARCVSSPNIAIFGF